MANANPISHYKNVVKWTSGRADDNIPHANFPASPGGFAEHRPPHVVMAAKWDDSPVVSGVLRSTFTHSRRGSGVKKNQTSGDETIK